eukprot:GILK01008143.1.p1 GENE.GILK01008143.1~~GILK01008143.1.p1  ORF type:complete len:485 (+),score=71.81 GILK01008143.1:44-1498(+)
MARFDRRAAHPFNQFLADRLLVGYNDAKQKGNTQVAFSHKKVINSLRKYPLPVRSGRQAMVLEGVGAHFAAIIKKILAEQGEDGLDSHAQTKPKGRTKQTHNKHDASQADGNEEDSNKREKKRQKKADTSIPTLTRAHTVPVTQEERTHLDLAATFDRLSTTAIAPPSTKATSTTSTSSTSTSISSSTTTTTSLTREPSQVDVQSALKVSDVCWDYMDLVMLIDNREVKSKRDREYIHSRLVKNVISCEVRKLELGDVLWVLRACRVHEPHDCTFLGCHEFVLDYVLERKTADDLASSIVDGRYEEQKYRLQRCGVQNVIYMIEGELNKQSRIAPATLEAAILSTQVASGFRIHRSTSLEHSIFFLTLLSRQLKMTYTTKRREEIVQYPLYQKFSQQVSKSGNLTVSQVFGKQLRQIRGLGADKTVAILEKYPTPLHFFNALQQMDSVSRKAMLASISSADSQRRMAHNVIDAIIQIYTQHAYA